MGHIGKNRNRKNVSKMHLGTYRYLLEHYFCKSQQGGLAMVSMINKAILKN